MKKTNPSSAVVVITEVATATRMHSEAIGEIMAILTPDHDAYSTLADIQEGLDISATKLEVEIKKPNMKTTTQYQPKTGEPCFCRPGMQRDNCPTCEGTGWRVDFKAIRERALRKDTDNPTLTPDA